MAIVITVLAYFCVLLLFSHLTARKWQVMKLSIVPTAVRLGIWLLSAWWVRLFRASLSSVCRAW